MTPPIDKHISILALLARLQADLGTDSFDVVDHWESDLCAIGLAMPSDPQTLVYISTHENPVGKYDYELESASKSEADFYIVAGRGQASDYEQLTDIIRRHLRIKA